MTQVTERIHVDVGYGACSVGAIAADGRVVLIDTPKQPTRAQRWRAYVEALGPISYVVNTEHHADHVFGNAFFPGTIIAHRETKKRFRSGSEMGSSRFPSLSTYFGPNPLSDPVAYVTRHDPEGLPLVRSYAAREPELCFDGDVWFSLGDVEIHAYGMPGHVVMNTLVHVPQEGVLFTGDQVFNQEMTWYHDCLPLEWLKTLESIRRMDNVVIVVPGHGPPGGMEIVTAMSEIVGEAVETVRSAINTGVSKAEAVRTISFVDRQPVSPEFRDIAPELQKVFVGHLYDELATSIAGGGKP